MREKNTQQTVRIQTAYGEDETIARRERHGHLPQRQRPMGVTIGRRSFATLALVPA